MNNKKKNLFISELFDTFNGWGTVAYYLSEEFSKEFNLIKFDNSKEKLNLNYSFNAINPFQILKIKQKLKNLSSVDYILCTSENLLPVAYFAKKLNPGSKLILIGYGTYIYGPFVKMPHKIYNRFYLNSVDNLFVSSNFSIKKVKEFYTKKITLLPLGVDSKKYYKIASVKKENSFVFVGQQKERKGVKYLIEAFERLILEFPNTKLYFVGPLNQNYKSLISEKKLEKNIIFTGKVSHKKLLEYFSKCKCHILPSVNSKFDFEGFGLVHLEANACGIPSIGSSDSANDDVIIDGKTGFLVKQKDSNDIYEKMKLILSDEKLYKKLVKNSIPHSKKYSWKNTYKKIVKEVGM